MSDAPGHPFVTVRARPEQIEIVALRLWELGATGLEERDDTTLMPEPAPGQSLIIAAFPDEAAAQHALKEMSADCPAEIIYLPRQDWATEWRRGFGAQRIGKRLLLHPSWEAVQPRRGDVVLTIDPENAFGSGDHETTRLVLRLLDELISGGERVLDVGCGSGILSIAALRLGAESALGIDIDPDAAKVAMRNAELNAVAARIDVSTREVSEIEGKYDVVVANIETRVLTRMPLELQARLVPRGVLILSGVLAVDRAELLGAYPSMQLERCLEEGEWCACVLRSAES